jgi:hypothetical protein
VPAQQWSALKVLHQVGSGVGWNGLQATNKLAYFASSLVTKKFFYNIDSDKRRPIKKIIFLLLVFFSYPYNQVLAGQGDPSWNGVLAERISGDLATDPDQNRLILGDDVIDKLVERFLESTL